MTKVRTYMNFSKNIDPVHIVTMSDLELSIALATPLVAFNEERQVVAALAEKWTFISPNKIKFHLRKNLKWSDGKKLTADEYKKSLDRAKKLYSNDLKALFDLVTSIESEGENILIFTTKTEITKSGILLKLTEPMYGIVALKNGDLDLNRTSGAYSLKSSTENEIHLAANQHWYLYSPEMPSAVEIRRSPNGVDLMEAFQKDEWATLVSGSSLMRSDTMLQLNKLGVKTWQRSLDKVFSLYPSKSFLMNGGANTIRFLANSINKNDILKGFTGFTLATQFFPRGYELWSSSEPQLLKPEGTTEKKSSAKIIKKTIKVIIPDNPYARQLRTNLIATINEITSSSVECDIVPLPEVNDRLKKGDFDILATGIAVADPNFEGAMSFFFEREPAFIQSGPRPNDFSVQIREARGLPSSKERASKMREIIIKAQEVGYVLPLFHFSSLAIAKPGIDLSEIPNSDETVLFSKVRLR